MKVTLVGTFGKAKLDEVLNLNLTHNVCSPMGADFPSLIWSLADGYELVVPAYCYANSTTEVRLNHGLVHFEASQKRFALTKGSVVEISGPEIDVTITLG